VSAAAPVPATPPPTSSVEVRGIGRHDAIRADRWTVRGTSKVARDVAAREVDLDGTVTVGGALRSDGGSFEGVLEVTGPIDIAGALHGRGDLRSGGAVHAGELELRGRLLAPVGVTVDRRLCATGWVRAGSIAGGTVELEGMVQVPGSIRGASVELRLHTGSRVGAVEGGSARVSAPTATLVDRVFGRHPSAHVERIEANSVELEGVDVAFVRAKEVTLGRGSHVTTLEGTVVRRHPTSRLGPESRSPPPYGLRR